MNKCKKMNKCKFLGHKWKEIGYHRYECERCCSVKFEMSDLLGVNKKTTWFIFKNFNKRYEKK